MDIPAETLEVLKCSSCEMYLSRGPVYLQHDGAGVCGRCYTPKSTATRNTQYEATAKLLNFPCKNQELGCRETVPFVDEEEVIAHEEVCEHRQYVCPVLGSASCDWLGTRSNMLAHCREKHPNNVLENPCTLTHDISKASLQNYILTAFQLLFLFHTKICLTSGKIFHSIRLLGESVQASDFHFNLDIKRNDELISKKGQVVPQGCLAIQEDTSLAVNTNSLLDMLGGFDGTTFTVSVKQKTQLVKPKCGICRSEVTKFLFRDEKGWRCKRCAPAKRACNYQNQGCTYTEISDKCWKHELFFCQRSTKCQICEEVVSPGSLSLHYTSSHQDITHRAGTTWWTTQTYANRCLLTSVAGTAVCWINLNDSVFQLRICSPLSSEQLKDYRCTVRVIDPATGHAQTCSLDTLYNDANDWIFVIKKEEFPSWNVLFDIIVDIIKI